MFSCCIGIIWIGYCSPTSPSSILLSISILNCQCIAYTSKWTIIIITINANINFPICRSVSDYCIITTDNPRSENPLEIIADIKKGIKKNNYEVFVSRKEAIKYAVSLGKKGDVIFIAGKGAERYQEIGGIKYAYNDEEYIMQLVSENYIIW